MIKNKQNMVCRICSSAALKFRFVVRDQDLWRCSECGFTQVGKEPSKETLDAIYSENYFTSSKYRGDPTALERENSRRLDFVKRYAIPGGSVLDAGCSTGDFIAHAKSSYQMYGNDYSEFAIKEAHRRNPELKNRFMVGRLEDTTWSDKYFDVISMWDVIEHVWNPVLVISELLSHVKPGGFIFFSTPAVDSWTARVMGPYWAFMTPPEHLSFFSIKAFEAAVKIIGGCEILYSARFGKWANLAFIAYKINRIAPKWFPSFLLWPLFRRPLNRLSIYVPTQDIIYIALRKI